MLHSPEGQAALFTAEEIAGADRPLATVCECGEPIEGVPVECGAAGAVWWSHAATGSPYCARPRFARPAAARTGRAGFVRAGECGNSEPAAPCEAAGELSQVSGGGSGI